MLGVSLSVMSEPKSPGDPAAIITLVCLATFIASFAATWGPVVWVMLPEILPLSVRGAALGVAVSLHWLANFAVSQTFPPMVDAWGAGHRLPRLRRSWALIATAFVLTFVTETKGRSLEEIEGDLQERDGHGRPPHARVAGDCAAVGMLQIDVARRRRRPRGRRGPRHG